ncbi:Dihydrolipoyllysine-residue acetyltransferase component of pyruvate dehydrogenase complex, mitochondrial [Trichinella spiralis]|uniref:Acetyltransferase component of pyruvate dehydrogenase complex n=1 Tax=Trichinella spiralis TaxID=6334 RepID=A0A0V1BE25_TRISP|nr:Dihydrolipoyllysine-residue acetyltransferase component of pyruvate dehydrogenase complex, mitochondrial [Trichinella spiralis]
MLLTLYSDSKIAVAVGEMGLHLNTPASAMYRYARMTGRLTRCFSIFQLEHLSYKCEKHVSTKWTNIRLLNFSSILPCSQMTSYLIDSLRAVWKYLGSLPSHTKVHMPALSPTMEKGNVVSWKKKEGEEVAEGDLLCEIETDKATMGFESGEEGYLAKIVIPEGSKDVPVGNVSLSWIAIFSKRALLCVIVENADDVAAFSKLSAEELGAQPVGQAPAPAAAAPAAPAAATAAAAPPPPPVTAAAAPAAAPKPPVQAPPGGRVFASPLAKKMAGEQKIDLQSMKGTGPEGRILAGDLSQPAAAGARMQMVLPAGGKFTDIELSNMRKTIARRLLESKTSIPHYYLTVEIFVDKILQLRSKLNEELKKENRKISVNDFIVKASALACKKVPEVNSFWMETFIRRNEFVDVSVAVSTDTGLITPIVFNADSKGILEISEEIIALSTRARAGQLKPEEFQGGTFTVSNLGMFGVNHFTAIINPPQSAILAVGTVQKRVVFDEDKRCAEANVLTVTLSCDHRIIDGAVGAKWLQQLKRYLEKPYTMLL